MIFWYMFWFIFFFYYLNSIQNLCLSTVNCCILLVVLVSTKMMWLLKGANIPNLGMSTDLSRCTLICPDMIPIQDGFCLMNNVVKNINLNWIPRHQVMEPCWWSSSEGGDKQLIYSHLICSLHVGWCLLFSMYTSSPQLYSRIILLILVAQRTLCNFFMQDLQQWGISIYHQRGIFHSFNHTVLQIHSKNCQVPKPITDN